MVDENDIDNDEIDMDSWIKENMPGKLSPENVPAKFRHLITQAEKWGISDDVAREEVISRATNDDLEELIDQVGKYYGVFDEWLAGMESYGPSFSREYIVFTCLRFAVDDAGICLERRKAALR